MEFSEEFDFENRILDTSEIPEDSADGENPLRPKTLDEYIGQDKAKENLKSVFDDMCSYTITSRTDTSTDEEGNTTSTTVKEVNVKLKTYHDMISEYGFDEEEQEYSCQRFSGKSFAAWS